MTADVERIQAENEQLRRQVDGYRQRELDALREQLVEAKAAAAHYRTEAQRNADAGRQIHTEAEREIGRLRTRIQSLEQLPNARSTDHR